MALLGGLNEAKESGLPHVFPLRHTHLHTRVREPSSGFINPGSVRETRDVTMVLLSYFLSFSL